MVKNRRRRVKPAPFLLSKRKRARISARPFLIPTGQGLLLASRSGRSGRLLVVLLVLAGLLLALGRGLVGSRGGGRSSRGGSSGGSGRGGQGHAGESQQGSSDGADDDLTLH